MKRSEIDGKELDIHTQYDILSDNKARLFCSFGIFSLLTVTRLINQFFELTILTMF